MPLWVHHPVWYADVAQAASPDLRRLRRSARTWRIGSDKALMALVSAIFGEPMTVR